MAANTSDCRRNLCAQFLEFSESSGGHDFPYSACDRFTDAGKAGQILLIANHFFQALGEIADACSSPLIGLNLVWIFFLRRQQLCEAGEAVGNVSIAEHGRWSAEMFPVRTHFA